MEIKGKSKENLKKMYNNVVFSLIIMRLHQFFI